VFALTSAIFSLLFFASTLPNGIRIVELPAAPDSIQIVAGYTSAGLTGFASTEGAKSLLRDAYAAGATIDTINELDRTALRITAPKWSLPMLMDHLPGLFRDVGSDPSSPLPMDFRATVEEEIRSALLGPGPQPGGYSTDDAFILISAPVSDSLREALQAIPKRASANRPGEAANRLPAERTIRFRSDLPAGAVILASHLPGVYYKQWYLMLLLDRVIHRIVTPPVKTTLPLTVRPYYYRIELPVAGGQFPEQAEENLLQGLQRLQYTPANARDLTAAREESIAYLESNAVREWFASHDILVRREEGIQWIQSMSTDDLRLAARDLFMNRVLASWSAKPRQTSVSAEPLDTLPPSGSPVGVDFSRRAPAKAGAYSTTPGSTPGNTFPGHTDRPFSPTPPERLSSGVFLAVSTTNAVFISGGPLTRFDRDLTPDDLKSFQEYRVDRILVLSTASSVDRARQLWSAFKGNTNGETGVPKGKVSSGDLPALFVLKTILELKLLESGWWHDAGLRVDASEGSALEIHVPDEERAQVLDLIKAIAEKPLPDAYFAWAREVAIHHFDTALADLQALTWERDPQGTIQNLATVSAGHVQDVARIYF
jgi:hypothetical protein